MSRFVSFEGIDGTGKSTVCKIVGKALDDIGLKVKLTSEPSDEWLGNLVKESYDMEISPFSEALLFCADRAQHTNSIKQWMGDGYHVLCDRYMDSTIAYQGALLRPFFPGEDLLGWLGMVNEPYILIPDLTFLLVAPAEVCLQRLGARGESTKFERLETLRTVHRNYQTIKKDDTRFIEIDAEAPLDRVVTEVMDHIRPLLEKDMHN